MMERGCKRKTLRNRVREIMRIMCCAYWVLGMQQVFNIQSRRIPCQPPGVEKPGSLYLCLSLCVSVCMCAFAHWALGSNPAVIYCIAHQIWVNSDTQAAIRAHTVWAAELEIPLWRYSCMYQQTYLLDSLTHTHTHTQRDTHTHKALSFLVKNNCPQLNLLLVSAAKCNLLHWSAHICARKVLEDNISERPFVAVPWQLKEKQSSDHMAGYVWLQKKGELVQIVHVHKYIHNYLGQGR